VGGRSRWRATVVALLSILAATIPGPTAFAQTFEAISIPLAYEGHEIELTGRFEKPTGAGPFPAAILLHGCEGYQAGLWHTTMMAAVLHGLGIATLIIDSYTPRGYATCGNVQAFERVLDVYAGAEMLAGRSDIQHDKIAVIGFSQGGATTLATAAIGTPGGPSPAVIKEVEDEKGEAYAASWKTQVTQAAAKFAGNGGKFSTFIAFYPGYCRVLQNENFSAPLMILIGDFDNRLSSGACEHLAGAPRPSTSEVRFKLYPGASRGFDMNLGYRSVDNSRYRTADRDVASDAPAAVRQFLRQYLNLPARTVPQISQGDGN
jgi:dienelactone hydrolase